MVRLIGRAAAVAVLLVAAAITKYRHPQNLPSNNTKASALTHVAWDDARWEPYKIAIGAFYALCVQRVFDTAITSLRASHPEVALTHAQFEFTVTTAQAVLLCQLLAYVIWIGLYHLNNVRFYLLVPKDAPTRRTLVHVALTTALGLFYFLAATIGRPNVDQLLLILAILVVDATFPLLLGPVLPTKYRVQWFARGVMQSAVIVFILVLFDPSTYPRLYWSGAMLGLMVFQALVVGPVERERLLRKMPVA